MSEVNQMAMLKRNIIKIKRQKSAHEERGSTSNNSGARPSVPAMKLSNYQSQYLHGHHQQGSSPTRMASGGSNMRSNNAGKFSRNASQKRDNLTIEQSRDAYFTQSKNAESLKKLLSNQPPTKSVIPPRNKVAEKGTHSVAMLPKVQLNQKNASTRMPRYASASKVRRTPALQTLETPQKETSVSSLKKDTGFGKISDARNPSSSQKQWMFNTALKNREAAQQLAPIEKEKKKLAKTLKAVGIKPPLANKIQTLQITPQNQPKKLESAGNLNPEPSLAPKSMKNVETTKVVRLDPELRIEETVIKPKKV